jgi:hypothetical protein
VIDDHEHGETPSPKVLAGRPAAVALRSLTRWIILIMILGFGSALIIYLAANDQPDLTPGYDALQSKAYVHDLKQYGGKANVMAAEFTEWFGGLWSGRNLAFTVACLTAFVVLVMIFVTRPLDSSSHEN